MTKVHGGFPWRCRNEQLRATHHPPEKHIMSVTTIIFGSGPQGRVVLIPAFGWFSKAGSNFREPALGAQAHERILERSPPNEGVGNLAPTPRDVWIKVPELASR